MKKIQINNFLYLEEVKLSHAETIYTAIVENKHFLRKWLPFVDKTKKQEDTEAFIKSMIDKPVNERDNVYTIWYKNEFAGLVGFKDTDRVNLKTELGYWLCEKMQGKGIITKSVSKLIGLAFKEKNMNRIQIKVAKGNQKSSIIPKRLNFHFEGIEREGELHTNEFLDLEIYSLLKKDWH